MNSGLLRGQQEHLEMPSKVIPLTSMIFPLILLHVKDILFYDTSHTDDDDDDDDQRDDDDDCNHNDEVVAITMVLLLGFVLHFATGNYLPPRIGGHVINRLKLAQSSCNNLPE